MQLAIGLLGSEIEHSGRCSIFAFERRERDLGLGVGVRQGVDQLGRRRGAVGTHHRPALHIAPAAQQGRQRRRLRAVVRRLGHGAAPPAQQVVDQGHAVAFGDRQHLVHAVRVERGIGQFGAIAAGHLQPLLAAAVAHQQLTAGVQAGQGNDQRGEHAGRLL